MGVEKEEGKDGWKSEEVEAVETPVVEEKTSVLSAVLICVFYGLSAVTVTLVNKHTVNSFEGAFALLSLQACCIIVSLEVAHRLGLRWVDGRPLRPPVQLGDVVSAIPMGVGNVGSVAASLFATRFVSIPVYTAVRRTGVLQVFLLELVLLQRSSVGKHRTLPTAAATLLVVCGALAAGWESFAATWVGVAWAVANNFFSAGTAVLTRRFADQRDLHTLSVVFYSCLIVLPVAGSLAIVRGEVWELAHSRFIAEDGESLGPLGSFLSSSILGISIVVSQALCTTVNSPLATAITGNIKDVLTTALSSFIFRDFRITSLSLVGLALSFAGSALFAVSRIAARVRASSKHSDTMIDEATDTSSPPLQPTTPPDEKSQRASTPEFLAKEDEERQKRIKKPLYLPPAAYKTDSDTPTVHDDLHHRRGRE